MKVDGSSGLGEEGYTMKIALGKIEIVAGGDTGAVWARQTLAQLKASGAKAKCGTIRDIPKYRVRAFMMDVGRMYHSMDFLYDLAKTMSYYKMNVLHIHLNDNSEIFPSACRRKVRAMERPLRKEEGRYTIHGGRQLGPHPPRAPDVFAEDVAWGRGKSDLGGFCENSRFP